MKALHNFEIYCGLMDYTQKWKIAMSRFNGYYANIPPFLKTEHIEDYHSYVSALEEASGEDLSHFKIPPERLKPKVISVRPGAYGGGPGSAQYSSEKYCDSNYFQSQIDGLKNYLSTLGPRRSTPNYEELNDFALEDLMISRKIKPPMIMENGQATYRAPNREWIIAALIKQDNPPPKSSTNNTYNLNNSALFQGSPGAHATISVVSGIHKEELRQLIQGLTKALQPVAGDDATKQRISLAIETINLNLAAPQPDPSIIGAALISLKTMIEGAGGAILATAGPYLPALAALAHKIHL